LFVKDEVRRADEDLASSNLFGREDDVWLTLPGCVVGIPRDAVRKSN
jgi:hypothetical protein